MDFPEISGRRALFSLLSFILLLTCLHSQIANAERFKVIGPDQPVVAVLGEDAVLPCHLSLGFGSENMQVRWFRNGFDAIVHLYKNGKDQKWEQIPKYRGRTELIRNHISNASMSLRIHNIGLDDEGSYTCFVRFDPYYEEITLELKVASLGRGPSISVTDYQDRGIRVLCESAGWYPEPEVTWRQKNGQSLIPATETETQNQSGLFNIRTFLLMRTNNYGIISCHIRNTVLNQERELVISIAEAFFQRVSRWTVSLSILLISVVLSFGLLVVLVTNHLKMGQQQKAKLSILVEMLTADKKNLSANVEKFSADNEMLTADKKSLSADNEMLTADKKDLSAQVERLSADNIKLSTDNAKLSEEFESLSAELEWRRRYGYAVNVTLDPETAHPCLIPSQDWRSVRRGDTTQNLPYNLERFDTDPCVLGCEGFTSGSHYWEVEVGDGADWRLGVCKDSVRKTGKIIRSLSPEEGYWAMRLMGDYTALTSPPTWLRLSVTPQIVGIFLDYEAGTVSFYNADDKSHLFTFTHTFTEKLRPFFCTYDTEVPLRILPVAAWK